MGKLKLREIQADIRNGYDYLEYEQTHRGENVLIILDRRENKVIYTVENRVGHLEFLLEEFQTLMYHQLLKKYNKFIYYSPIEEWE